MQTTTLVLLLCILGVVADARSCTRVTQRLDCGALTCNTTTHECAPCTASSQCYEEGYQCNTEGQCVIRNLPESFRITIIFAPVVAIIVGAVAAVAGVGGGAILVPAYIWLLGLPISDVVPLSQATIFGLSIVNAFIQLRRHHPHHSPPLPTWPLINWEYLVLLLPSLLVGTMLGSIGNKVSPGWFRVVLLIALLSFVLYRLLKKIIAQRRKDAQASKAYTERTALLNNRPQEDEKRAIEPFPAKDSEKSLVEVTVINHEAASQEGEEENTCCANLLLPLQQKTGHNEWVNQKPQYPWRLLFIATVFFCVQLVFVSLNSHTIGITHCGSTMYWLVIGAAVIWSVVAAASFRAYLIYLKGAATTSRSVIHPNVVPFKWNSMTSIVFPIISFAAGGAASMLGVGGGMILNFLLLEADLLPEEVSATGGLATLLVAGQSIILYLLGENLEWDFGLLFFAAGAISALVGQIGLVRPIKRRGLTFLFIVCLVVIMAGSLVSLSAYGIYETVEIISNGGSALFGELCG